MLDSASVPFNGDADDPTSSLHSSVGNLPSEPMPQYIPKMNQAIRDAEVRLIQQEVLVLCNLRLY